MSDLLIIRTSELLEIAKKHPTDFMRVVERAPSKTAKKPDSGTYFDIQFLSPSGIYRACLLESVEDIGITGTPPIKGDAADARKAYFASAKLQIDTTVSHAGSLGQVLMMAQPIWKEFGTKYLATHEYPTVILHDLAATEGKPKDGKEATIFADPYIHFKTDFKPYSDKHPNIALRNKPKTTLLDFSKPIKLPNGQITGFSPAGAKDAKGIFSEFGWDETDGREKAVNDYMSQFITQGSVIHFLQLMVNSACIANNWLTVPMVVHWANVEHRIPSISHNDPALMTQMAQMSLGTSSSSALLSNPAVAVAVGGTDLAPLVSVDKLTDLIKDAKK
jgi:hypothetical protein